MDERQNEPQQFSAAVTSSCTGTVEPASDRRYCSMTLTLAHVVKNQELVYAALHAEFDFTCSIDAHQCDGNQKTRWLSEEWGTKTFCVVDHADVDTWVRKAYTESLRPQVRAVVCLCPARTNTEYFHNIILKHAQQVRFIKGRLRMKGHDKQSPFPSCLVVFGGRSDRPPPKAVFERVAAASTNPHV